jgi:hypothetical protein
VGGTFYCCQHCADHAGERTAVGAREPGAYRSQPSR